jgi:hypothetical protein
MKLWFFHEFARLFEPYGHILTLDPNTADMLIFGQQEYVWSFCDAMHLPQLTWILYCDPNGFWTQYDVTMEIESDPFGTFPLHRHLPHPL